MALLRGRRQGLEIALAGRELDAAFEELRLRLAEQPGFYRGSAATAAFGATVPSPEELIRLQELLSEAGIELQSVTGVPEVEGAARTCGIGYRPADLPPEGLELERRRALRPPRDVQLSDSARSLVADFAGARADIADRRKRGESSVRRVVLPHAKQLSVVSAVPAPPATLYHAGTLRGGQALHHDGNIVVVGDVNPGAELIASGDVVVFGRLAGVAHAGAQGDAAARVYALHLDATQLRIATFIAAEGERDESANNARAGAALVRDGRIAVVALDQLGKLERGVPPS